MKYISLLLITFLFFSCEKNDEISIDSESLLVGYWANAVYNNEEITFSRNAALPDNEYGIAFEKNGNFTEKSSGFCGTPPLSFFNIEGTWEAENTLIKINTSQSNNSNYNWRIISLSEAKLIVKRELSEQEKEHRELMKLFNEFNSMSNNFKCIEAKDWDFVAYGSKACGGPQGFVAYNTKIDVTIFLNKVKIYTDAEKAFNIKWEITSTCDNPQAPKNIECKNGYPNLVY